MATATATATPIVPGVSLGPFALGASIHDALSLVKADKARYPAIELHYSHPEPATTPVVVTLPENGLRLHFDGPDQRLRLIEVVNFRNISLTYKGSHLVKPHGQGSLPSGPQFKRVYSLLGPSFPGEYFPPRDRHPDGTYVLSWPGVAFNFPVQHAAYSRDKDHVSLLGSHVASPAKTVALFEGRSWPEARRDLFVKPPAGPRVSAGGTRVKDSLPADIELASIRGDGRIDLLGRSPDHFTIVLNQTTPQDLLTELGPPDATHRREDPRAPAPEQHNRTNSISRPLSNGRAHPPSQPSSYSSTGTDTFDSDFDDRSTEEDPADRASRDKFWCYFSHGMDILVGLPSDPPSPPHDDDAARPPPPTPLSHSPHPVVLKVVLHGNVPGSYAFNRHRRLRWDLDLRSLARPPQSPPPSDPDVLTSEHHFDTLGMPRLLAAFAPADDPALRAELSQGKVVNRTWGGTDPGESFFVLEEDGGEGARGTLADGAGSDQWLGNTKLYAFPGLVFEVLESGFVSALTVG